MGSGVVLGGVCPPPPNIRSQVGNFWTKPSISPPDLVIIGQKNMFRLKINKKNWYNLSHIVLFCLNWSYFV